MAPTTCRSVHTVPAAGSAPPASSKVNISPAMYIAKPALAAGTMGTAGGYAPPLKKPTVPGTAVLLRAYAGVPAGQVMAPAPMVRNGSTQAKSLLVSVALPSGLVPPAALGLSMPQVPLARSENGTTRLWVASITESTTPPAPQ